MAMTRRLRPASAVSFLCFALLATPSPSSAQGAANPVSSPPADAAERLTVEAVRLDTPLVIDGRLDDAVYGTMRSARGFVQQEPREGEPATEDTEVWVFFDGNNLYISARCWDSQPERMVSYEMRRDHRDILDNENFTVVIDTFRDRRSGYYFQSNPLSALRDQQVTDERTNNNDWNTVWDVQANRDERGWSVEMVIPFKSVRYQASGPQTWGINFRRMVRWKNEVSYFSPVPASYGNRGIYKFTSAADLVGIEVPAQAHPFELKPYGKAGSFTDLRSDAPRSNEAIHDLGLDMKYGLTSSVIADFTVNTDFAQVEDDEQQVNLTRFSLFFPEKREFFLEGQGIFAFGGGRQGGGGGGNSGPIMDSGSAPTLTPVIFFSRRIGLDEGLEVPIRAGGRVTGRAGAHTIGLLNIQTGETAGDLVEPTNFSVVRVKRDLLQRSSIGFIGTRRSAGRLTDANQAFGVDSSFALLDNLTVDSYYARTSAGGIGRDQSSHLARVDYTGDRYGFNVEHLKVGDAFNPEVGFLRRDSFKRMFGSTRFSPRPRSQTIRKLSWEASFDYITDPEGRLESREVVGTFRVDFNSGDQVSADVARNYELLKSPFAIAPDVSLDPGAYGYQEFRTVYYLGPQRKVSGRLNVTRGSFYNGERTEAGFGGRVDLGSRIGIEPRVTFNWVDLPAGSFLAQVVSSRVSLTLSPRMALASLVQYSSNSSMLSSNIRFRWEYQPGSDLFVVYNDGRSTLRPGFLPLENRTFVVKMTRLFRM